jgi:formate--tetrahydrofolate ligase
MTINEKIICIAKEIYHCKKVVFSSKAKADLKKIEALGRKDLKICLAKTQYSFSDDPEILNAPSDHILNIRDIEFANGAGFVIPICGSVMRMPGLPAVPQAVKISLSEEGKIVGLN